MINYARILRNHSYWYMLILIFNYFIEDSHWRLTWGIIQARASSQLEGRHHAEPPRSLQRIEEAASSRGVHHAHRRAHWPAIGILHSHQLQDCFQLAHEQEGGSRLVQLRRQGGPQAFLSLSRETLHRDAVQFCHELHAGVGKKCRWEFPGGRIEK